MTHVLTKGDRYEGAHGQIWQIDGFGIEMDIFDRTHECVEVSCPETRDRSWIPESHFVDDLNDEEAAIALIDRVDECECCEQPQIIHSSEEVTL